MMRTVPKALRPQSRSLMGWLCACLLGMTQAGPAHAEESSTYNLAPAPKSSGLRLSGFGTLGYWLSNGPDDLQFRRELGQNLNRLEHHHERADSRLGLQLNYQSSDRLEWVGQVVAREKADNRVFNSVEWAFVKYRPTDDTEVRLGRIGLATFMLSDYRNVGYAYHWVRPPTEFYGWIPFYSLDGGDVVQTFRVGEGHLKTKLFGGMTHSGMPWGSDSYQLGAHILGIGAAWESDEWRLRAYHTRLSFTRNAPFAQLVPYLQAAAPLWPSGAQFSDDLVLKGKDLSYSVIGVTWDHDGWQLASEVALTKSQTQFSPQGISAYWSVGKRFDKWLPFVSFARSWDLTQLKLAAPPTGFGLEPLAASLVDAYRATHTDQYTASAGVRWDFADHMALKLQWDRTVVSVDGTQMWGYGSVPWNGAPKHVWSATLDFAF